MDEDDLTRQEEDISAREFAEEESTEPDFGNWPELFGLCLTAILVWLTFAFVN